MLLMHIMVERVLAAVAALPPATIKITTTATVVVAVVVIITVVTALSRPQFGAPTRSF